MDSLMEALAACRINAVDDDGFVARIDDLVAIHGEYTYQSLILFLTSIKLSPKDSQVLWQEINQQRSLLTKSLQRNVSLITAISDLLTSKKISWYTRNLLKSRPMKKLSPKQPMTA